MSALYVDKITHAVQNCSNRIVIVGLLLTHALLLLHIAWRMSPNQTEVGHMGATVYFWKTLRFDVFHVNPPLTRIIAGLPVMMCAPACDGSSYSPNPQDRCEWTLGSDFVASNSPDKLHSCFALARWICIPFLLVGGYAGWCLSRDIYGDSAGVIFATLWCFSPSLLAWGATICPDALAASLGILGIFTFRQCLRDPKWRRVISAGVCLGLLPLSKLTWIIAFGIWPVIWAVWVTLDRLTRKSEAIPRLSFRQLSVMLLVGLYMLNTGYMFEGTFRPLGDYVFVSQTLRGQDAPVSRDVPLAGNRFSRTWLGAIPVPLPVEFVQGIDTQRWEFERGKPSYLCGTWSDRGWSYYYLYALAVKLPLGTWCLLLLAVFVSFLRKGYNASWRDELLLLLPFLAILMLVSSQTGFSLHLRYVIPVLPFLFIWISKVGRACVRGHSVVATLAMVSISWMIISSMWLFPHSLSYFNELADGPRNGPKHLLGSNVDWGQDLFYLERWVRDHPNARPIRVAYWGTYPLELTDIESAGYPPRHPRPGWYALSVNELHARSEQYRFFLRFEPVAMAGYSIYIYHIMLDEANRVRRELGLPELSGDWEKGVSDGEWPSGAGSEEMET